MSKLSVVHVVRPPLPWRDPQSTECGLALDRDTITREELKVRSRDWGRERVSMTTCMTCLNTTLRHQPWSENPASAMARAVAPVWRQSGDESALVEAELRAIAALIEAHRDEFDAYIAGLGETTSLAAVRQAKLRRRA